MIGSTKRLKAGKVRVLRYGEVPETDRGDRKQLKYATKRIGILVLEKRPHTMGRRTGVRKDLQSHRKREMNHGIEFRSDFDCQKKNDWKTSLKFIKKVFLERERKFGFCLCWTVLVRAVSKLHRI